MAKTFISLSVGLLMAWSAAAAELCEISINSSNPRRVDIQFPGKKVSVVGHTHPYRDLGHEDEFEAYLYGLFNSPFERLASVESLEQIRGKLDRFLLSDAGAVAHWTEDYETLQGALIEGYKDFAIEYPRQNVAVYDLTHVYMYNNAIMTLNSLGYNKADQEKIMRIGLHTAYFTKVKQVKSFGDASIISVEPGEVDIVDYGQNHCPKTQEESGISPKKQKAMRDLNTSLMRRGFSAKTVSAKMQAGQKLADEYFEHRSKSARHLPLERRFDGKKMVAAYLKGMQIKLRPDELKLLRVWCDMGGVNKLDADYIMANLPQLIADYDKCWGREALIAKGLADRDRSTMLFIGIGHLAPQAALLRRECLARVALPSQPVLTPFDPVTGER